MSAQAGVGKVCLRATIAICVTVSAGMKQRNPLGPVHQASKTITEPV